MKRLITTALCAAALLVVHGHADQIRFRFNAPTQWSDGSALSATQDLAEYRMYLGGVLVYALPPSSDVEEDFTLEFDTSGDRLIALTARSVSKTGVESVDSNEVFLDYRVPSPPSGFQATAE